MLHYAGIPETIFDINASLPKTIAIVDGIVAMEGDGPIMGSAKPMGLLVIGTNSTAVDATLGRIMGFDPARIGYLKLAANRLGPVEDRCIEQRGERWQSVASPFTIIDCSAACKRSARQRRAGYLSQTGVPGDRSIVAPEPVRAAEPAIGRGRSRTEPVGVDQSGGAGGIRRAGGAVFLGRVYVADDLGEFHLPMRTFYAEQLRRGEAVRLDAQPVWRLLRDRPRGNWGRTIPCICCCIAGCRWAPRSTWSCWPAIR